MARLLRRPNQYVSYDYLLQDVWQNQKKSDHTVRSAIRELRTKLTRAGMPQLASALKGQGRHYGLILHHQ
jgi:DNA-binding winged helix-turn-helix (wHTH) protein